MYNLVDSEAAKCACYNPAYATVTAATATVNTKLVYVPNQFDGPWSSCIAYARTAYAAALPYWTNLQGWCASMGDVRKGGTTNTRALTTSLVFYDDLLEWKYFAAVGVNVRATALSQEEGPATVTPTPAGTGFTPDTATATGTATATVTRSNFAGVLGVRTWFFAGVFAIQMLFLVLG